MTLFGLVRHGQTDYNRRGLYQGSVDIPLNAAGIEQAHRALSADDPTRWDRVVTSSLQRARQTGAVIADDHGLTMSGSDPRLVELDWGADEGLPVAEMEQRYPRRTFPGRESAQAAADRGYAALADLAARWGDENVLVVAHGTLIRLLLTGIVQRPLPSIPNGTLSLIRVQGRTWSVEMIAGDAIPPVSREAALPPASPFRVEDDAVIPHQPSTEHDTVHDTEREKESR